MIEKPEDADWYNWEKFLLFCETQGVECDLEFNDFEDVEAWWKFWKAGYCSAMNS